MIDLHSHTTSSDGQHTPAELLELAQKAGVTTLAVTDHDTVSGLAACAIEAARRGIRLVNGIEVSAFLNGREVHILGHFVDPTEPELNRFSARLKTERRQRMEQMVEKMRGLGFPVTMEQVLGLAQDAHLGRPHLARVMVELNYCTSTKDAFDRFLGDHKPGWVDRFRLSTADAIALIKHARGVATLAHPGVSRVEPFEISALQKEGLGGLEVEHSDHPPSLREKLHKVAQDLDLVPTSGSDFHGELVAPRRHLGTASMRPEHLVALEARSAPRPIRQAQGRPSSG